MTLTTAPISQRIPAQTLDWLTQPDNPAVAALTRRLLGHEAETPELDALWNRRNEYAPVASILDAQQPDGAWAPPARDYKKYEGSLWQIHFLGELWANGDDDRIRRGADYAFGRQMPDGAWSCNATESASIPCLTANVGRALARLGWASDERVVAALAWIARTHRESGILGCAAGVSHTLNGYCHMFAPKALLFLAEVPRELWPDGAEELREASIEALRAKEIFRCLPKESRSFQNLIWETPASQRQAVRAQYLEDHPELHYSEKPGWLRFGYPLSYNSDALEALLALAAIGEPRRPEYEDAIAAVESQADDQMRWAMRTTLNGKMLADVEAKLRPSKWVTLRALSALSYFEH